VTGLLSRQPECPECLPPPPAGGTQRTAAALLDFDFDGMPDLWEIANGLNYQTADAWIDTDGDGVPNILEMLQGTQANNASSVGSGSPYVSGSGPTEVFTPLLKF
jgi:hypothetical protein